MTFPACGGACLDGRVAGHGLACMGSAGVRGEEEGRAGKEGGDVGLMLDHL